MNRTYRVLYCAYLANLLLPRAEHLEWEYGLLVNVPCDHLAVHDERRHLLVLLNDCLIDESNQLLHLTDHIRVLARVVLLIPAVHVHLAVVSVVDLKHYVVYTNTTVAKDRVRGQKKTMERFVIDRYLRKITRLYKADWLKQRQDKLRLCICTNREHFSHKPAHARRHIYTRTQILRFQIVSSLRLCLNQ